MIDRRAIVLAALLGLIAAGCSSGGDATTKADDTTVATGSSPTTHSSARATTTTRGPIPSETTTVTARDVGDWVPGLRYDFGMVTGIRTNDGVTDIDFDRYALYDDKGATVDHWDSEPILGWHSDVPWENNNGKLRRYAVAPDARYLVATDHCNLPNGDFKTEPPTWGAKPLAEFTKEVSNGYPVVSLSFDANGSVTQLRLDPAC